ncbi:hypothetical protein B0H19DRAFT_1085807 [Mycena capillaripes]|nr:hypothetical protein B0H19DRAFT_1085807 [Mycena capillaripes]
MAGAGCRRTLAGSRRALCFLVYGANLPRSGDIGMGAILLVGEPAHVHCVFSRPPLKGLSIPPLQTPPIPASRARSARRPRAAPLLVPPRVLQLHDVVTTSGSARSAKVDAVKKMAPSRLTRSSVDAVGAIAMEDSVDLVAPLPVPSRKKFSEKIKSKIPVPRRRCLCQCALPIPHVGGRRGTRACVITAAGARQSTAPERVGVTAPGVGCTRRAQDGGQTQSGLCLFYITSYSLFLLAAFFPRPHALLLESYFFVYFGILR